MADELEQLRADSATKRARLAEEQVLTDAENTVAHSRVHDLAEQSAKAYRRIAAARGRVTRALKDGDADTIAAAHAHLAKVQREFEEISHANLREMNALNGAALDRVGGTLDAMRESWEADGRVWDATFGRPTA
jgi:hypothetical protein